MLQEEVDRRYSLLAPTTLLASWSLLVLVVEAEQITLDRLLSTEVGEGGGSQV